MELTKSQKIIARQINETVLQREYEAGIKKLDYIISEWKRNNLNNRDAYMKIYDSVIRHDKQIARRYDNMSGSKYLFIIASQLAVGIITIDELNDFPKDMRDKIVFISRINED